MTLLSRIPSRKSGAALSVAVVLLGAWAAFGQPKPASTPLVPPPSPAAAPLGPRPDRALLGPQSFTSLTVVGNERNPFGLVSVPEPESGAVAGVAETEEAKIRRVLANMRISGMSGAPGDYSVLIGPLMLREGELVPQLFADQAEVLRVKSITEREVTFTFVESDSSLEPRTFGVSVDVAPKVRSLMPGDVFLEFVAAGPEGEAALPPIKTSGVEDFLQGAEEQKHESMVDRSLELLGVTKPPARDESAPPDRQ
ncbi:MAG: hypothetical protein IAE97_14865 [Chthoniobacterales bacterium]|nr:hypothetical protein [Chthoniobacterales bacterium]